MLPVRAFGIGPEWTEVNLHQKVLMSTYEAGVVFGMLIQFYIQVSCPGECDTIPHLSICGNPAKIGGLFLEWKTDVKARSDGSSVKTRRSERWFFWIILVTDKALFVDHTVGCKLISKVRLIYASNGTPMPTVVDCHLHCSHGLFTWIVYVD